MSLSVRLRRPTLVVAYGSAGEAWLRQTAALCRSTPSLTNAIDGGLLQFWWVGGESEGRKHEPLRLVEKDTDARRLRELIDQGLSERARAANPNINMHQILVLERWSMFAQECAARTALRAEMRVAQRVDCDANGDVDDFSYDWVGLADAVRGAAKPGEADLARARKLVGDRVIVGRTFLVDRVSEAGSTIDADLANECFQQLAMTYLNGDIGASRLGMREDEIPAAVRLPVPHGNIVPFALSMLVHPWAEIESARVRAFRVRAAQGLSDLSEVSTMRTAALFSEALNDDRRDIDLGKFDPHAARVRRRQGAGALLSWALATGSMAETRTTVAQVRQAIGNLRMLARDSSPELVLRTGTALAFGVPLGDLGGPLAIMAAVVAVVGAVFLARARRGRFSVAAASQSGLPAEQRANVIDAADEWEKLCGHLDDLLKSWETSRRAVGKSTPESSPAWEPRPPLGWRLGSGLRVAADDVPLTAEGCERLAQACLESALAGSGADEAIDQACREMVRRLSSAAGQGAGTYISCSLEEECAAVAEGVARRPFLLKTGVPVRTADVSWIVARSLGLDSALRSLEPAGKQDTITILDHDDSTTSVRIAFGEHRPWTDVLSLDFLNTK